MWVHRQGESVSISFVGLPQTTNGILGLTSIPTTGSACILKDANLTVRTLAANERLIVDSIAAMNVNGNGPLLIYAGTSTGALNASGHIVLALTDEEGTSDGPTVFVEFPGEGLSLPLKTVPVVTVAIGGAGSFSVCVIGTGRIVQDAPITNQRPNWKEVLTGAGVPPGNGATNTVNNGGVIPGQSPQIGLQAMAPDGLPDGSQTNVSPNAPIGTANPSSSDPTPGSLLPPANGGSI